MRNRNRAALLNTIAKYYQVEAPDIAQIGGYPVAEMGVWCLARALAKRSRIRSK